MRLLYKHTIEDADAPIKQWWIFQTCSGTGLALVKWCARDAAKTDHTFQRQEYDAWNLVLWGPISFCMLRGLPENWIVDIDRGECGQLVKTEKGAKVQAKTNSSAWTLTFQRGNNNE